MSVIVTSIILHILECVPASDIKYHPRRSPNIKTQHQSAKKHYHCENSQNNTSFVYGGLIELLIFCTVVVIVY